MDNTMKAAFMTDLMKVEIRQVPVPQIKPDEVLVKIAYVGVCGSDLHYLEKGRIGDFVVELPFVLGHECSGIVVACGDEVTGLSVGDHVTMEPGKTCGKCEHCKKGKYNLCPDVEFFATPPIGGVLQEYVAHNADLCFKLPENISLMEGALVEPLSVGYYTAQKVGAGIGQTAVVFGAGCIGLSALLGLKASGVPNVYVVDILEKRLDVARRLGAAACINAAEMDVVNEIKRHTAEKFCDIVVDAAGSEKTLSTAIDVVKKGGNIAMVGYSASDVIRFPMNNALNKEVTLHTIFRYRHIYPAVIQSLANNMDCKGIVTNIFDFEDIEAALQRCIYEKENIVKAVIKVS